jgi:hypothetical protein
MPTFKIKKGGLHSKRQRQAPFDGKSLMREQILQMQHSS